MFIHQLLSTWNSIVHKFVGHPVNELWVGKNSFSTYVCYTLDVLFWCQLYMSFFSLMKEFFVKRDTFFQQPFAFKNEKNIKKKKTIFLSSRRERMNKGQAAFISKTKGFANRRQALVNGQQKQRPSRQPLKQPFRVCETEKAPRQSPLLEESRAVFWPFFWPLECSKRRTVRYSWAPSGYLLFI